MASLAIGRLKNRLTAPEIAGAWDAAPILDQAARRLPGVLDDFLPDIFDAAGLPEDAVIALRRLDVRLTMGTDPDRLVRDWAIAIGVALREAIGAAASHPAPRLELSSATSHTELAEPGQDLTPGAGRPVPDGPDAVAFPDRWTGEAAVLRLLAEGHDLPWWVEAVVTGPPAAASLIGEWIERDPARAAATLLEFARARQDIGALLSPAVVVGFTSRLLERLAAAGPGPADAAPAPDEAAVSIQRAWRALPAAERTVLSAIPEDRRALFVLAALAMHAPAVALHVATLAAGQETRAVVRASLATQPLPDRERTVPEPAEAPATRPAGMAVMHGGLLLLCRPLSVLGLIGQVPASEVASTLLGIGLLAMRRVSQTLSPAARRVVLERDRALLTVFAGTPPPDSPLDTLPVPDAAEPWLNAVLDVAPRETLWAAGAERRYFGGPDPFGETPDGLLARLLLRPGRLVWTPFSADLTWPAADIALRRAGWDIDPGWMPWIGRVVRFHYDDTVEP